MTLQDSRSRHKSLVEYLNVESKLFDAHARTTANMKYINDLKSRIELIEDAGLGRCWECDQVTTGRVKTDSEGLRSFKCINCSERI